MKQILEQYASAVIAGMLGLVLFIIINQGGYGNGFGISKVLGVILQDSISGKSIVEKDQIQNHFKENFVDMEVKNVYVTVNQEITGSDCFTAKNREGNILPVYWKNVWDMNWEPVNAKILVDKDHICFPKAGVYWVQFFVLDKNEKEHSWVGKLLVNER